MTNELHLGIRQFPGMKLGSVIGLQYRGVDVAGQEGDMASAQTLERARNLMEGLRVDFEAVTGRSPGAMADLEAGLVKLLDRSAYGASQLFAVLRPFLNQLASRSLGDGFLEAVYDYVLSLSFPEAVREATADDLLPAIRLFLTVFRALSEEQMVSNDGSWQSRYPLRFLTEDEAAALSDRSEYDRFLAAFRDEWVYEMMRLNQELLGFDTLDHICGVVAVALQVSRQLKALGYPIDLGRVCGAAAGHDLGKYGCRPEERDRIPYLHYYYSDVWFRRRNMPNTGHTAVNHSVWDVELENLPVESLVLIYADFRVKGLLKADGTVRMHLYSLAESFTVVLSKLDAVDESKERRYRRVYARLRDFEDFMVNLGVGIDPGAGPLPRSENELCHRFLEAELKGSFAGAKTNGGADDHEAGSPMEWQKKYFPFLSGKATVQSLKYMAMGHNIKVLYQLRDESSLNRLLDIARGNDHKHLRQYLQMLEEYSPQFTQKQKLVTLRFLFDHLTCAEDDVRNRCARLMGMVIADFDEDYRKELPTDVVLPSPPLTATELLRDYGGKVLRPDYKLLSALQVRVSECLPALLGGLFAAARNEDGPLFVMVLVELCGDTNGLSLEARVALAETIGGLPVSVLSDGATALVDFLERCVTTEALELRVTALEALLALSGRSAGGTAGNGTLMRLMNRVLDDSPQPNHPAEATLLRHLAERVGRSRSGCERTLDAEGRSGLLLDNLKTAVFWGLKRVQIRMLTERTGHGDGEGDFYIAMHLCNLLKVSGSEKVRNEAGKALLVLLSRLAPEKKNDVIVELVRALQLDGPQFAEHVPAYLGQALLLISPRELDEVLNDFSDSLDSTGPSVACLILRTLGITLQRWGDYSARWRESETVGEARRRRIVGLLLRGLVNYDSTVKETAFNVIGIGLLGSRRLGLDDKAWLFARIAKKLLTLISEPANEELFFMTNSASLNSIYRFIGEWSFERGAVPVIRPRRAAFFPGAFDPFSRGHKDIVRAIRDLDFEVFLAVDEFSWSKSTLPNQVRKDIINMSIADELHVYLFPSEFQINIASDRDMAVLGRLFGSLPFYLVVGSDVLCNASAYRTPRGRILSQNHVVFDRKGPAGSTAEGIEDVLPRVTGDVIRLSLPAASEDVSSTQIRANIDEDLDISSLVEGSAQNYIYANGLYRSEPRFKATALPLGLDTDCPDRLEEWEWQELRPFFAVPDEIFRDLWRERQTLPEAKCLRIRDAHTLKVVACALFHRLDSHRAYDELKDGRLTDFLRKHATGKILFIDGLYVDPEARPGEMGQILLTETLSHGLAQDYQFAFFLPRDGQPPADDLDEAMTAMSFLPLGADLSAMHGRYVSMVRPNTIIMDLKSNLKEPWRSMPAFAEALSHSRRELLRAIGALTPGSLLLVFKRTMLLQAMTRAVCEAGGVSTEPQTPRQLGECMCVPYGDIMKKTIVPNLVTKSLHTEKSYGPDMSNYTITATPFHLDLTTQIRMLRSFERPVILVDDLLDRGYRLETLLPIFRKMGTPVKKIVVGIISARGRELIAEHGYELSAVHYLPRISIWFNEKYFYPFLGGYTVRRPGTPVAGPNAIPSINHILPYCSPDYLERYDRDKFYELSRTAMENARLLLSVLESEYRDAHEKSLSLAGLGQVLWTPRVPDQGIDMAYNLNMEPSHYLQNSEELLKRLGPIRL